MSIRIIKQDGFDFSFDPTACMSCPGYCCWGKPGNVWVNQEEILEISSWLQINMIDFIAAYLNRVNNRLTIKERFADHSFECVFFEASKKQCSIYPVRPLQCRRYPFWDYFREHKLQVIEECPGILVKGNCPV